MGFKGDPGEGPYQEQLNTKGSEDDQGEEQDSEDDEGDGACMAKVIHVQKAMEGAIRKHGQTIKYGIGCLGLIAYACYFAYAISRG